MDPAHLRHMPAIEAAVATAADPIEVPRKAARRRHSAPLGEQEHIDTLDACPLLSELLYDRELARQAAAE